MDMSTGVFVWTTTFLVSPVRFRLVGKPGPTFLFLSELRWVSIKNILVPDMTVRSVFFSGVGRKKGRRNGVDKVAASFFFSRTLREDGTKGEVYLLGRKGFRLPAEKSRPAKLMI